MVRMWNVSPDVMCRQHLLGEHVEMHMVVGSINRGKSITGYTSNGLLDTRHIQHRHDSLVTEMSLRGYNHQSPLDYTDSLYDGSVDKQSNLVVLADRCTACKALQRSK